jgi:predicted kinase
MPTVYLLCGPIGSGKTTHAHRLERELPALRISLDEWIVTLFGAELPSSMTFAGWSDRAERCSRMSWSLCRQALAGGLDVVLDCGFIERAQRDAARDLAKAAGAQTRLHLVRSPTATRRARVERRNLERDETFAIVVTADMFDSLPWEPPGEDELDGGAIIET